MFLIKCFLIKTELYHFSLLPPSAPSCSKLLATVHPLSQVGSPFSSVAFIPYSYRALLYNLGEGKFPFPRSQKLPPGFCLGVEPCKNFPHGY